MKKSNITILKSVFILGILTVGEHTYGQVRIANSNANQAALNSSAFIDASSNIVFNNSSNIGKGLLFPRTNLTQFNEFGGNPVGVATSYPNFYDGLIVYNTANIGKAGIGTTEGTLTPGYWYYDNKSGTINGGIWKPFKNKDISTEGSMVMQKYILSNVNGDWVEDFNTNIPTSKYTVLHVGSGFNKTLNKPNVGDFCPTNSYVYEKGGTWRIYADFPKCTAAVGNGEWIIYTLIISKDKVSINSTIEKNLGGGNSGSAPSPVQ